MNLEGGLWFCSERFTRGRWSWVQKESGKVQFVLEWSVGFHLYNISKVSLRHPDDTFITPWLELYDIFTTSWQYIYNISTISLRHLYDILTICLRYFYDISITINTTPPRYSYYTSTLSLHLHDIFTPYLRYIYDFSTISLLHLQDIFTTPLRYLYNMY